MDFIDVVNKRQSIRKFTSEKIDKEILDRLMDMVIKSPTAMNAQNRIYTVIQNQEIMDSLAATIGEELGRESYNFMGAPCLVLVSVPEGKITGIQDSSIALAHLYLVATNEGLGACWINQFKEVSSDEYRKILSEIEIPDDYIVYAGMVLGYADEKPPMKEKNEPVNYFF